jgi:hypothetical protein
MNAVSPPELVSESKKSDYYSSYRESLIFNRADFHTQPYGVTYETAAVWGTSKPEAEGCVAIDPPTTHQIFILVTDNGSGCSYGKVSEKAQELGASALVI